MEKIFDKEGNRIVKCRTCHKMVKTSDCWIYGGPDTINEGECYVCEAARLQESKEASDGKVRITNSTT